jgi:hypothetical protein
MKKLSQLITLLLTCSLTYTAHAKTYTINYHGDDITKDNLKLSAGDIIIVVTNVDAGTEVKIRIWPVDIINSSLFTFVSNLPDVYSKRFGDFTDTMHTKTNPDSVSYQYTGERNKITAGVSVSAGD